MPKMFLVSPHQFSRLTRPEPSSSSSSSSSSIRQAVEDDLDVKMQAVINEPGLSHYEKMKKYDALLQRYLALIKQGQKEERRVTLTLHPDPTNPEVEPEHPEHEQDDALGEILSNLPPRDRKNAEYILKKLFHGDAGWNSKGELIYKGTSIKGSHMIDLLKNLSLPYKRKTRTPPRGWTKFLNILAELNIPLSSVNNPQAREEYGRLKSDETDVVVPDSDGKRKIILSPSWSRPEKEEETPKERKKKKRVILSPRWSRPEEEEEEEDRETYKKKLRPKPKRRKVTLSPRWIHFKS